MLRVINKQEINMKGPFAFALGICAFSLSINIFAAEYEFFPNVAEYQHSHWTNLVKIERRLTLEDAFAIADKDSSINYFFFVKRVIYHLNTPRGLLEFGYGDVAFFSGEPRWGSAYRAADGYVKKPQALIDTKN